MITSQISLFSQEKELKKLIADAEQLGFAPQLIQHYQSQLSQVQAELSKINEKKLLYKKSQLNPISNSSFNQNSMNKAGNNRASDEDDDNSLPYANDNKIFLDCVRCKRCYLDNPDKPRAEQICPCCTYELKISEKELTN